MIRKKLLARGVGFLVISFVLLLPAIVLADGGRVDGASGGFFTGAATSDQLGRSVAAAGDVNGDGFDDFLIGVPLFDTPAINAGAAYLVLGRAAPWSLGAPISQVPTIRYSGEMTGDQAGTSVAGAGDVNGDGFDDMLVGAPFNGGTGAAYLILGSANPTNASLSAAIKFTGQAANDEAGASVAGAGDVDADGFADILIGAPRNDAVPNDSGAAYLVRGQSGGGPTGGVLGAIKYSGEAASYLAGTSVAGVGDVNGDGFGDMAIGAPDFGVGEGGVYLVLGNSPAVSSNLSTAIRYEGLSSLEGAGHSVARAGDVNGDGLADILVGTERSIFYLILGRVSGLNGFLTTEIRYILSGTDLVDTNVGGAGDVNGDGYADMLAGTPTLGGIGTMGTAFLILGSSRPQPADIDSAVLFDGTDGGDSVGDAVAGAGDVNGDGLADFLIGAPGFDNFAQFQAGAAFVYLSDSLHSEALSYRQRQRLTGSGDARPVLFDQSRVRLDFTFAAFSNNDIQVNRYLYHPCSTGLRLATPIWDVSSNKVGITSQMTLRFQYTNNQVVGMTEGNLVLWTRPSGQPCAPWIMVPGSVVDTTHNFVSISGLTTLGQFTIADSPPSPTALDGLEVAVSNQSDFPIGNMLLMLLIPASGTTYWYLRSRREERLEREI